MQLISSIVLFLLVLVAAHTIAVVTYAHAQALTPEALPTLDNKRDKHEHKHEHEHEHNPDEYLAPSANGAMYSTDKILHVEVGDFTSMNDNVHTDAKWHSDMLEKNYIDRILSHKNCGVWRNTTPASCREYIDHDPKANGTNFVLVRLLARLNGIDEPVPLEMWGQKPPANETGCFNSGAADQVIIKPSEIHPEGSAKPFVCLGMATALKKNLDEPENDDSAEDAETQLIQTLSGFAGLKKDKAYYSQFRHSEQALGVYLFNDAERCRRNSKTNNSKCLLWKALDAKKHRVCDLEALTLDVISVPNSVCSRCESTFKRAVFGVAYEEYIRSKCNKDESFKLKMGIRVSSLVAYRKDSSKATLALRRPLKDLKYWDMKYYSSQPGVFPYSFVCANDRTKQVKGIIREASPESDLRHWCHRREQDLLLLTPEKSEMVSLYDQLDDQCVASRSNFMLLVSNFNSKLALSSGICEVVVGVA